MTTGPLAYLNEVRAARSSADLEAMVFDAVGQAIIATDLEGKITYWNGFAQKLYGWTAEEVLGRSILDVTPTSQSREIAAGIFQQLVVGQSWSGEFTVRDKNGRWFPVHVTDTPLRDGKGGLIGVVGVSVPVAKKRDARRTYLNAVGRQVDAARAFLTTAIQKQLSPRSADVWDAGQRTQASLRNFGLTLAVLTLAITGRLVLDTVIPGRLPFITFFPGILVISLLCGIGPTIVALFGMAAAGAYWLDVSPSGDVSWRIWSFALFFVFGGANAAVVFYLKHVLKHLKQADEQLSLLNQELKHRIKNLFAIVSAICARTARYTNSVDEAVVAIQGRIAAIASAQDLLSVKEAGGSDLRSLIDAVVRPMSPAILRLIIEGPDVSLPRGDSTHFALILHELTTNALKHGAWAGDKGQVSIEWRLDTEDLDFRWREHVELTFAPPIREGFGRSLISRALSRARVEYDLRRNGLDCRIRLRL